MSVEQALIAQAGPHMAASRAQAFINEEAGKGCNAEILPSPVALEPAFSPLSRANHVLSGKISPHFTPEPLPPVTDLLRLQIWLSPDEKFDWLNSELFLKQLHGLSHRIGFEIVGNNRNIQLRLLAHCADLPVIQTAFKAQFEHCELSHCREELFEALPPNSWDDIRFLDCFPPPPYSHLLTRPDELKVSTYRSIIAALMEFEEPAIGFYQALLQPNPPEHDWFRNIQALIDIEYNVKLLNGPMVPQRYLQQTPSGDLRQMALEVETKSHNDKPIYSAAVRLGVISAGEQGPACLKALSTFLSLFQHGGRPLNSVTHEEYRAALHPGRYKEMFLLGATYRPGFLLNSEELAGFIHIPPSQILKSREPPVHFLETLPALNPDMHSGTPIGTCEYAGTRHPVCIPPETRSRSTHIIGKPGQAKSTTMGRMILDDIHTGTGLVVIDPHGDLVETLLCMIGEKYVEKTIYLDPGNPEWVPIWNPMKKTPDQSLSRTAEDLVAAIKSVVTGWGDRLEHLLRHGFYALLQLPESTLLDLSNLLRHKTDDSRRLREEILEVIDNETARRFWKYDFDRYSNEALDPPKHKLSKLLVSDDTVSLMLSQPDNLIDFRKIMDEGMILLVNLSNVGSDVREILGCFMLSLFHLAALGRREERRQFNVYADEAHRFITEALEDLIAETRKFGVSLTLAHHYLSQFGAKKADALSSVGTTIIMNVDTKDARYLTKDLQGLVVYKDLITLNRGEAIARIGTKVVRVTLGGPLVIPERHFKDAIMERSHSLYYRPLHMVRKTLQKGHTSDYPMAPLTNSTTENPDELLYDEF